MTAKGNGSPNARRHSLAKLWGSPHPTCAAQFAEPSDDQKFFVRGSREGDSQRTALGQNGFGISPPFLLVFTLKDKK
jgi:hypothetical protein